MRRITVTSSYIQIGNSYYPLNALIISGDGTSIVNIINVYTNQGLTNDIYSNFCNSAGVPYTTYAACIAALVSAI